MNYAEIEQKLTTALRLLSRSEFLFDFMKAYDFPATTIRNLKNGANRLSKKKGRYVVTKAVLRTIDGSLSQYRYDRAARAIVRA